MSDQIPESEEVRAQTLMTSIGEVKRISETPGECVEVTIVDNDDHDEVVLQNLVVTPEDFDQFIEDWGELIDADSGPREIYFLFREGSTFETSVN